MQDSEIVNLYWERDEAAIEETEKQYGKYLLKIASNILYDTEDAKESVNDTYLAAWKSIPPHKPEVLSTYLGKITRQLSIDIYRKKSSKKRRNSEYAISLTELNDCLCGGDSTIERAELKELAEVISAWLLTLSPEMRNVFVGRYYFADSIREVADYYKISQSKVKSILYRARIALKEYLEQEGFQV